MNREGIKKVLIVVIGIFFLLLLVSTTAQAKGLIDETINSNNNYSKYPVDNYTLDYFVDSKWDWLPWNWGDGVGKSVMFGIYSITNLIWLISVYLSKAAGYLVGEAYSLDFISDTTEAIGRNIQTLAGINQNGFMSKGFYPGLLLILILVMGIYVTYTGLIKRETTKATSALISFVAIFILSSSFIAYSSSYISKINDFSSDLSSAALDVGSRMTMPNADNQGKSSVDAIKDSLFEIQVKKPWMILQYGDSDIEKIGKERVDGLESTSPFANKGKDRIEIIKKEINDKENDNLTVTKTINRLGVAIFIFLFNILISVFVFILTGIMIFSQVLFIVFAVFLPVSFLLSMIPSFNHLMKTTIIRLFNVIMMRAGITLVLTISFSLSAMIYSLTESQPFFIIAFMQIVVFAGIYFKLNDLMGMMALSSAESQNTGGRVMRRPKQTATRTLRKIAISGFALKGLTKTRSNRSGVNESEKGNSSKKNDQQEKQMTTKREQHKNNTLAQNNQKTTDKNDLDKKNNRTKKPETKEQKKIGHEKDEAARKFKQAKYKGNNQRFTNKDSEPRNAKDSKRQKATPRTLNNPKSKTVGPKTNLPNNSNQFDIKSKDSVDKKKNDSKTPEKSRPLNQSIQSGRQQETKTLEKGNAVKRVVTSNQDKQIIGNKADRVEKTKKIKGKGAKRK